MKDNIKIEFKSAAPSQDSYYKYIFKPITTVTFNNTTTLHYVTPTHTPLITDNQPLEQKDCTNLPLFTNQFFEEPTKIKIPSKVLRILKNRYIPAELLKAIDDDEMTAIELCLIFLSNLTDTYFKIKEPEDERDKNGWKRLSSEILHKQTSDTNKKYTYLKILAALTVGTNKGGIVERDDNAGYKCEIIDGESKCYYYRLTEAYRCKGIQTYQLTSKKALKLSREAYYAKISLAQNSTITRNLISFYGQLEMPTQIEVVEQADILIAQGFITKKGNRLIWSNNHTKDYYKYPVSFVEDHLKIYDYLTDNGKKFRIPDVGKNGARPIDSLSLLPSWIRSMIKINGVLVDDLDYVCLHPNISVALYGGENGFITHPKTSEESGVDIKIVKIEHVSFFNRDIWDMAKSPLYKYYKEKEPYMMRNIENEKYQSQLKYKTTSQNVTSKEVDIMSDVIFKLNNRGIFVGYVYDALFFHPIHKEIIRKVMNQTALEHGVKTTCK